jgi:hypothetical protein
LGYFFLENIFQEAIIESFNQGESDLLVSWSHGFGLKARRKIYMHDILWTIPLEHIPWPGNSLPSAPEMPTETADMIIRTKNQKIFFFAYKLVEILFNFLVFLADNWKLLLKIFFTLSQIIFVKEIFNNYRSKQVNSKLIFFFKFFFFFLNFPVNKSLLSVLSIFSNKIVKIKQHCGR